MGDLFALCLLSSGGLRALAHALGGPDDPGDDAANCALAANLLALTACVVALTRGLRG